jgi:hypothetical protein
MRNDDAHIKSVSAKTTHAPAAAESPIHSFNKSGAGRLEQLRSLVIPYATLPWVQRKRPGVPGRKQRTLRPLPMLQLPAQSLPDRT